LAYTLNYIEQYLEQLRAGTLPPDPAAELHGGYLALVRTLARRTAEMHIALATRSGDPAFDPEPIEQRDIAAWTASVHALADSALTRLEAQRASLDVKTQPAAGRLLAARESLLKRIDTAAPPRMQGFKTRLHGDYHLGQVLLVQNDFVITDFEGEPARSLAERRQKHSALKDVAGMLRSFNYALFQALSHATTERPDALAAMDAPTREWELATRKAFLDTYRETSVAAGLYPAWEDARRLLDLFIVEKACYELGYELSNRPDWVRVPLAGLLDLMRDGAHD
jgi:maltose alpha-D-glucosyltransferase/alpha-amylase